MIIKVLLLLAVITHSTFNTPYVLESLLFVMASFSVIYYQMIFMLKTGLHVAHILVEKEDLKDSVLANLTNWTVFVVLFQSEYQLYSIFFLPWLILSSVTLVFALLIFFKIFEIKDSKDED